MEVGYPDILGSIALQGNSAEISRGPALVANWWQIGGKLVKLVVSRA
jgi:hypothetical protein